MKSLSQKATRLNWPSLKDFKPVNFTEQISKGRAISPSELKQKESSYPSRITKLVP